MWWLWRKNLCTYIDDDGGDDERRTYVRNMRSRTIWNIREFCSIRKKGKNSKWCVRIWIWFFLSWFWYRCFTISGWKYVCTVHILYKDIRVAFHTPTHTTKEISARDLFHSLQYHSVFPDKKKNEGNQSLCWNHRQLLCLVCAYEFSLHPIRSIEEK